MNSIKEVEKRITKIRGMIIKRMNRVFDGCQHNLDVISSVIGFLASYAIFKDRLTASESSDFLCSYFQNINIEDIYEMMRRNLYSDLPDLKIKNDNNFKSSDASQFLREFPNKDMLENLSFCVECYTREITEAIIVTHKDVRLKDSDITFMCIMIIKRFIHELSMFGDLGFNLGLSIKNIFNEIADIEKESKHEIKNFKEENDRLKSELRVVKNAKEKVKTIVDNSRVFELEKCLKNKDIEINSLNKKIEELSSVYNIVEKSDDESNEQRIDFDKKLLFIGGHSNTISCLERLFRNSKFISYDEFDKNELCNCDGVIYLTSFLSHSLYYKVKNLMEGANQIHCSFNNVANILQEMQKHEFVR